MSEKNEWKPIESAPKDGQSILGWGPCQDAVVITWNEWAQPEPTWEAVGLEVNGFECPKIVLRGEPTLWQPLPDEPSKYAGDHDGMENEPMAIWAAEQREAAPAPSAPGDAQDERQAFEAWFARRGVWPALCFEEVFIAGWNARPVAAPAAGDARAWQGLTDAERDGYVGELVDYGTDFVAPLYSVVESIEKRLREKNAASQQHEG